VVVCTGCDFSLVEGVMLAWLWKAVHTFSVALG
jgi:hypothetical protein